MSTKAQLIERLSKMSEDTIIAVPVLWTKDAAEDQWNYMRDEEIELTNEQWAEVVKRYETADFYDEEAMIDTIREVLGEEE